MDETAFVLSRAMRGQSSLGQSEQECAAVAKAPRVSLADIENAILELHHFTGAEVVGRSGVTSALIPLSVLSICIVVLNNGFTIIGKSAPASPENFDRALGQKLAYEDAVRQIWPLMGFALRDRLVRAANATAEPAPTA